MDGSLIRYYSADFINSVLNDDTVFPWCFPYGTKKPVDIGPSLLDVKNVLLCNEHGGFVFHWREAGCYEIHTQFLPPGRGAAAVEAVFEALDYMFTKTDCMEVVTRIPANNDAARTLALATGFRQDFIAPKAWRVSAEEVLDVGCYVLTWRDWMRRAQRLVEHGEWFHAQLEELGLHPEHDEDVVHNRAVGATIAMIQGGQLDKAITLYNRWARLAAYMPITLLARTPVTLDIGTAVIVLETEIRHISVLLRRT